MTQSEFVEAAVPAAANSFSTLGTITVPANVKRLTKIRIGLAIDGIAAAAAFRWAPVIRLLGSGLIEQSPHQYVCPCGGLGVDTTGYAAAAKINIEYDVDIPVETGGTFDVQLNTLDEAIAAGDAIVNVFFDEDEAQANNNMSDFVDAAVASSADTWVTVGTLTVPRSGEGRNPTFIKEVDIGLGLDQGAVDFALRHGLMVRLSGSGIDEGGLHEILGAAGDGGGVTPGAYLYANTTEKVMDKIPVNAGGQILVEQRLVGEVPTAGTVVVGVIYE